ncbi:unnamed protein product [Symbiodinium sp. CCMP2456]|nr:unnamed protein product [Symbiodinium sp. CCMP2456]
MGCTASTVVEGAQKSVFQHEDGVTYPEVRFSERSHSFDSMDDLTNPYTADHASAPAKGTHTKWVKQLEKVLDEIKDHPKALQTVVAHKRSIMDRRSACH